MDWYWYIGVYAIAFIVGVIADIESETKLRGDLAYHQFSIVTTILVFLFVEFKFTQ
jgi:hypothetical protein